MLSRIDARNGAVGIVPRDLDGAIVSNDFWLFDIDDNLVDPRYFDFYVGTEAFVDQCKRASEGTTNRVRLQPERFLEIRLTLPPIDEQRRLLRLLDDVGAALDEAEALRLLALQATEALVPAMSAHLLRPQPSWPATTIQAACVAIIDNLHTNPVYADFGVPCVRSSDVGWGSLNLGSARRTSEEEYRRRTVRGEPREGDIVFVREGGGTGKAALVEPGQRFSLGQRVMMLRPNRDLVMPRFLLFQLLSPLFQEDQIRPRILGSASPHLNISALRSFQFYLPPADEQARVVRQLDGLSNLVSTLRTLHARSDSQLTALRRGAVNAAVIRRPTVDANALVARVPSTVH